MGVIRGPPVGRGPPVEKHCCKECQLKITYSIDCPEKEETDSILGILFGGQIRDELNGRSKEEEGTNGHQVEVPGNGVTPESVIDAGQIGCKQSESNTEL